MGWVLNRLSLKAKLTLIISMTSSLILLLTFAAFIAFEYKSLRLELVQDVQLLNYDIGENCAAAIVFDDIVGAVDELAALSVKPHVVMAHLLNRDDQLLASYTRALADNTAVDPLSVPLGRGFWFSEDYLDTLEPVIHNGEILGRLFIRADLTPIRDKLYHYAAVGGAGFVVYSLIAFLLASFLQRVISQPIAMLATSMEKVTHSKNYSQRLVRRSQDELGQLFEGFNRMLEEIEKRENDLRRNEKHLDHIAHHDTLTGLANRMLLIARMEQSLERSKRIKSRMAVLFIDLDRFKQINDSFGHDYGDQVLCLIADRLRQAIRDADTIARIGGDEFIVVIEQVRKAEDLHRFVQKLLKDISQAIDIEPHRFHVTATVGISIYPDNADHVETLLKRADLAMYEAKDDGRNSYQFYSAEMNQDGQEKILLESRLRQALDDHSFVLHYQPQFDMKSGLLIGFEALLRWEDPVRGLIAPDQFVPLAEDSGLIIPIGEWIICEACRTLKYIQDKWSIPLRMAVNISPRQFRDESLIPNVAKALYRSQLAAESLELEITESMVMDNVSDAIAKMNELKRIGVQLAIDDFGTGYSSLGYLKKFPLTRLKIDRSFVTDIVANVSDQAIVNSIIALGKTMNLEIIAEGIETTGQYDFLMNAQCDQAQGFLLGKPMAFDLLSTLLDSTLVDQPERLRTLL